MIQRSLMFLSVLVLGECFLHKDLQRKNTASFCRNDPRWHANAARNNNHNELRTTPFKQRRLARLIGTTHGNNNEEDFVDALKRNGYDGVIIGEKEDSDGANDFAIACYRWNAAAGMLQLVKPASTSNETCLPPRWIPVVQEQEKVLVTNGWSFLDVDESEEMSPFDVDAANLEGLYRPKWGRENMEKNDSGEEDSWTPSISSLGFELSSIDLEGIQKLAQSQLRTDLSQKVLLEGATDPFGRKKTHNGYDFSGSVRDIEPGIFACALVGLPLFASADLSVSTATSGWLSFTRPIARDHVVLVDPVDRDMADQRIEVLCAKTHCHLGHYFGAVDGFCINASVLNFFPGDDGKTTHAAGVANTLHNDKPVLPLLTPLSYLALDMVLSSPSKHGPSVTLLQQVLGRRIRATAQTVVLGAGCFWHVEFALRRLPGIVDCTVGYAGGRCNNHAAVNYEKVCEGDTGHAEVVRVDFDPANLDFRCLLDCFLAMHDPTKVRAHGKHAARTGQYRSCIFLPPQSSASSNRGGRSLEDAARQALKDCQRQLNRELSTELRIMESDVVTDWFFPAEERHQRHEEKRCLIKKDGEKIIKKELHTLSQADWLELYGRRNDSILGSANVGERDFTT